MITHIVLRCMANGWISFGATSEAWNNQPAFDEDSLEALFLLSGMI